MRYSRFKYIIGISKTASEKAPANNSAPKHQGSFSINGGPTVYSTDIGTTYQKPEPKPQQAQHDDNTPQQPPTPGYATWDWLSRGGEGYEALKTLNKYVKKVPLGVGNAVSAMGKSLVYGGGDNDRFEFPATWGEAGNLANSYFLHELPAQTADYFVSLANLPSDVLAGLGITQNAIAATGDAFEAAVHYFGGDKDAAKRSWKLAGDYMMQDNLFYNASNAMDVSYWSDAAQGFLIPDMPEDAKLGHNTMNMFAQLVFDPKSMRWIGKKADGTVQFLESKLKAHLNPNEKMWLAVKKANDETKRVRKAVTTGAKHVAMAEQAYGAPAHYLAAVPERGRRSYEEAAKDAGVDARILAQMGYKEEEMLSILEHAILYRDRGGLANPRVKELMRAIDRDRLVQSSNFRKIIPDNKASNRATVVPNLEMMDEMFPLGSREPDDTHQPALRRPLFLAELLENQKLLNAGITPNMMYYLAIQRDPIAALRSIDQIFHSKIQQDPETGERYILESDSLPVIWDTVLRQQSSKIVP